MDNNKDSGPWAKPPNERNATFDEGTNIDSFIDDNHIIRIYDLLLSKFDWSNWEKRYNQKIGQPPIHPFYIAGILLYGITEKIRSSRDLETACLNQLDFIWFLKGRKIDHSTFAKFRKQFETELKDLSNQIKLLAHDLMKSGDSISVDGTRIRSNSSRHGAKTIKTIEKKFNQSTEKLNKIFREIELQDTLDFPDEAKLSELEKAQEQLIKEQKKLKKAMFIAKERDIKKQKRDGSKAKPAKVPVTDSDSSITPNKEGGFAPNYTPVAMVDNKTGIITYCDVPAGSDEAGTVLKGISEIEKTYGKKPEKILFDGGFKAGENLKKLAENNIKVVAPIFEKKNNPAIRPNPNIPVPSEQYAALPLHGKTLDKSAFIYDHTNDEYYCPSGNKMPFFKKTNRKLNDKNIMVKQYRCKECEGCPLAEKCLSRKAQFRMITRDEYEPLRENLIEYMKTEVGKELYKKRAPNIEGLFGHIKGNLGIRQFLLRSLKSVRHEWNWICSACNLRKTATFYLNS